MALIIEIYIAAPTISAENQVAFFVQKTTTQSNPPTTVTFETVVTEIGGLWNRAANNFLVPTKGMYFFHLTGLMHTTGQVLTVYIRKDLTDVQRPNTYAPNYLNTGSAAVVMELEEYSQVSCWLTSGGFLGADS